MFNVAQHDGYMRTRDCDGEFFSSVASTSENNKRKAQLGQQ